MESKDFIQEIIKYKNSLLIEFNSLASLGHKIKVLEELINVYKDKDKEKHIDYSKLSENILLNNIAEEKECLDIIFKTFYVDYKCKKCDNHNFRKVRTRKAYQCTKCYDQIFPCTNTIFHKSTTSLIKWFKLIQLFKTNNKISSYEAQRILKVTYKTAWRMLKQIKKVF